MFLSVGCLSALFQAHHPPDRATEPPIHCPGPTDRTDPGRTTSVRSIQRKFCVPIRSEQGPRPHRLLRPLTSLIWGQTRVDSKGGPGGSVPTPVATALQFLDLCLSVSVYAVSLSISEAARLLPPILAEFFGPPLLLHKSGARRGGTFSFVAGIKN